MNRMVVFLAAAAFASAAFAAANDGLVVFSTKGPDKYADGATVMDGECYALAWTPSGSDGVKVAADGTAQGGEIALVAPVAKGGRCPKVLFEVDAADLEAKYKDGSWSVILLDTRRWGADGTAKPAGTVNGKVGVVNATGVVAGGGVKVAASERTTLGSSAPAVSGSETAVPAGAPKPLITAIKVDGANVFVSVKNTVPYIQYGLKSGGGEAVDAQPRGGADSPDEEIVLVKKAKPEGELLAVGRK